MDKMVCDSSLNSHPPFVHGAPLNSHPLCRVRILESNAGGERTQVCWGLCGVDAQVGFLNR